MPFSDVKPMLSGSKRYKEQLKDVSEDRDVDRGLRRDEPAPGSDAYLKRREKEAAEDLRRAPRRGD